MRCTCDDLHELDPLNPESEYCPVHDAEYASEDSEWGFHEFDFDDDPLAGPSTW